MVSVIKSIMMLEQECMLPNANFEEFNPDIVNDGRLEVSPQPPAFFYIPLTKDMVTRY